MKDLEITAPAFGPSPIKFLKDVKKELLKVVWPTRQEVVKLTFIVILISIIVSIYLGLLDFIFTQIITLLIKK